MPTLPESAPARSSEAPVGASRAATSMRRWLRTAMRGTRRCVLLMLAALACTARPAWADGPYLVSFSDLDGDTGSVSFTLGALDLATGFYDVTAVSGAVFLAGISGGETVTGLLPAGSYAGNDNAFDPTGINPPPPSLFTFAGVSFELQNGIDLNFTVNDPVSPTGYVLLRSDLNPVGVLNSPGASAITSLTVSSPTPSSVPEPRPLVLMGLGLAAIGVLGQRARSRRAFR